MQGQSLGSRYSIATGRFGTNRSPSLDFSRMLLGTFHGPRPIARFHIHKKRRQSAGSMIHSANVATGRTRCTATLRVGGHVTDSIHATMVMLQLQYYLHTLPTVVYIGSCSIFGGWIPRRSPMLSFERDFWLWGCFFHSCAIRNGPPSHKSFLNDVLVVCHKTIFTAHIQCQKWTLFSTNFSLENYVTKFSE